jgi:hypothetical protein
LIDHHASFGARYERSVTLRVTVFRSPDLLRATTVIFALTVRPFLRARFTARFALLESRNRAWFVRWIVMLLSRNRLNRCPSTEPLTWSEQCFWWIAAST